MVGGLDRLEVGEGWHFLVPMEGLEVVLRMSALGAFGAVLRKLV